MARLLLNLNARYEPTRLSWRLQMRSTSRMESSKYIQLFVPYSNRSDLPNQLARGLRKKPNNVCHLKMRKSLAEWSTLR